MVNQAFIIIIAYRPRRRRRRRRIPGIGRYPMGPTNKDKVRHVKTKAEQRSFHMPYTSEVSPPIIAFNSQCLHINLLGIKTD